MPPKLSSCALEKGDVCVFGPCEFTEGRSRHLILQSEESVLEWVSWPREFNNFPAVAALACVGATSDSALSDSRLRKAPAAGESLPFDAYPRNLMTIPAEGGLTLVTRINA